MPERSNGTDSRSVGLVPTEVRILSPASMERPRVTVAGMIFDEEGKILLLRSRKWFGKFVLPGGHVEFGESLEDALKREVKEETGIDIKNIRFQKVIEFVKSKEFHNPDLHFVGIQFLCDKAGGDLKLNHESQEPLWIEPKNALEKEIISPVRESILEFLNKS